MSLLPLSRPIDRVWLRAGFEKREYQIQRRRGERMSLLPLSRPIDRVWLRAGFEKREYQIQRRRGERICVEIFILNHPAVLPRKNEAAVMLIFVPGL
jgi:hypothetical protein